MFEYILKILLPVLLYIILRSDKNNKVIKQVLINMLLVAIIVFSVFYAIKNYTPIEAMQNYEIISPILLFGILNALFIIIINYSRDKVNN